MYLNIVSSVVILRNWVCDNCQVQTEETMQSQETLTLEKYDANSIRNTRALQALVFVRPTRFGTHLAGADLKLKV